MAMIAFDIPGGLACPYCRYLLGHLAIDFDQPPLEGLKGYVIICQACGAFSVVEVLSKDKDGHRAVKLRMMEPEERVAFNKHPFRPLFKKVQEQMMAEAQSRTPNSSQN